MTELHDGDKPIQFSYAHFEAMWALKDRVPENLKLRALLPCGHDLFHFGCVGDWLKNKKQSCPLCLESVDINKNK